MKTMRKGILAFFVMFVFVGWIGLFVGCNKHSTEPEPQPQIHAMDGFWLGSFMLKEKDSTNQIVASGVIAPTGETFILTLSPEEPFYRILAYGDLFKAQGAIQGNLSLYDTLGNSCGVLNIFNGRILETTQNGKTWYSLVAQFSGTAPPLQGRGDLVMTALDSMYQLASSLSAVAGHWEYTGDNAVTYLDISNTGNFSGGNNWGCQFTGKIEIINARKNLYNISTFTISQCGSPWDGDYRGLAFIADAELHWLVMKRNESFGFFVPFHK